MHTIISHHEVKTELFCPMAQPLKKQASRVSCAMAPKSNVTCILSRYKLAGHDLNFYRLRVYDAVTNSKIQAEKIILTRRYILYIATY